MRFRLSRSIQRLDNELKEKQRLLRPLQKLAQNISNAMSIDLFVIKFFNAFGKYFSSLSKNPKFEEFNFNKVDVPVKV